MTPRAIADLILARLFAPPCAACGHPVARPLLGAACDRCWSAVTRFTPPLCAVCGAPIPSWRSAATTSPRCPRCRRGRWVLARQAAIGPYDGTLRALVQALKYDGRRSIAPALSAMMREAGRELLADAAMVVPVPLHRYRQWRRGFNQADLLASELGPPVRRLLRRVRATPPQVTLPAAARHRNVRDAFRAVPGGIASRIARRHVPLDGLVVVLVDDVATTGATLESCARVLKDAGAAEVRAVTAARVVVARPG